jgi:hypothetical protein
MQAEFDFISENCFDGLYRTRKGFLQEARWGFIDRFHEIKVPFVYAKVQDFSEGIAAVRVGNWNSHNWGFINTEGKLVIPAIYENPRNFRCGLSKVIAKGKWYFINKHGERVINLEKYDGSTTFHDDYCLVWKNGKSYIEDLAGVIDLDGNEVVPCVIPKQKVGSLGAFNVQKYYKANPKYFDDEKDEEDEFSKYLDKLSRMYRNY